MARKIKDQPKPFATCKECSTRIEFDGTQDALEVLANLHTDEDCAQHKAEATAERLCWVTQMLEAKITTAQRALAGMTEKASTSITELRYQLSWSRELFELTGSAFVAEFALACLKDEGTDGTTLTLAELHKVASERLIEKARFGASRSTSSTSNLMDDCELKAWAELVRDLAPVTR